MSITDRIAPGIPGEHREAAATFTDFDRGIAARVAYARQHPGVAVRMFVLVDDSKRFDHPCTVFEVKIRELAAFMRAGIRRQHGEEPPI